MLACHLHLHMVEPFAHCHFHPATRRIRSASPGHACQVPSGNIIQHRSAWTRPNMAATAFCRNASLRQVPALCVFMSGFCVNAHEQSSRNTENPPQANAMSSTDSLVKVPAPWYHCPNSFYQPTTQVRPLTYSSSDCGQSSYVQPNPPPK
jgi:hypothetical protein